MISLIDVRSQSIACTQAAPVSDDSGLLGLAAMDAKADIEDAWGFCPPWDTTEHYELMADIFTAIAAA